MSGISIIPLLSNIGLEWLIGHNLEFWSNVLGVVSVKFPTESLAQRIKMPNPSMTELEQCMVARMPLTNGMRYEGLCSLWGRSNSSIGNYCKKRVLKWGFAGQDILSWI